MQSPTITFRPSERQYSDLNEVIETSGMTKSDILREALDDWLQTNRGFNHA